MPDCNETPDLRTIAATLTAGLIPEINVRTAEGAVALYRQVLEELKK